MGRNPLVCWARKIVSELSRLLASGSVMHLLACHGPLPGAFLLFGCPHGGFFFSGLSWTLLFRGTRGLDCGPECCICFQVRQALLIRVDADSHEVKADQQEKN